MVKITDAALKRSSCNHPVEQGTFTSVAGFLIPLRESHAEVVQFVPISHSFTSNNLYPSLPVFQYLSFHLFLLKLSITFLISHSCLLPFHFPLSISKSKLAPLSMHPYLLMSRPLSLINLYPGRTLTACVTLSLLLSFFFLSHSRIFYAFQGQERN